MSIYGARHKLEKICKYQKYIFNLSSLPHGHAFYNSSSQRPMWHMVYISVLVH
jgi:hypothetical protein